MCPTPSKHHTSLCRNLKKTSNESKTVGPQTSMTITGVKNLSGNILPTAQIIVSSDGTQTYSLSDICSQNSFIVKSLSENLNLPNICGLKENITNS